MRHGRRQGSTRWAYCHVPHGRTVDMTERIEKQIERFAPGFRDWILTWHARDAPDLEERNAKPTSVATSRCGADRLRQFLTRPVRAVLYSTPTKRDLSLRVVHPAGRRRAWHVRLPRGPGGDQRCVSVMAELRATCNVLQRARPGVISVRETHPEYSSPRASGRITCAR